MRVITLFLLCAASALGQQHAPTVEMCRADRALWYNSEDATEYLKAETAHWTDGTPNPSHYVKLGLPEVFARIREMGDCASVDAERSDSYQTAQNFYASIIMTDC